MISFTQIPVKLKYPVAVKSKLSSIHSCIISLVIPKYSGTFKERLKIVDILNSISYSVICNDTISFDWTDPSVLDKIEIIDSDICKSVIGDIYLNEKKILWDIEPVVSSNVSEAEPILQSKSSLISDEVPTPKEALYIRPPQVPRFDNSKVVVSGKIDDSYYVIRPSLPEVPSSQNEISATTDVSLFTSADLRRLYPNRFIPTRSPVLYERSPNMAFHEKLGVILPINGYSESQVIDNIIKYPHLFRLTKLVDNKVVSFYTTIELDGELYKLSEIWKSLPESNVIPYNTDFMKEYVVRRYLLERDVDNIEHKYPMVGTLDPFLTLFTTPADYVQFGYSNIDEIAEQCVKSRVSYKRSRNPVLRRLENV